MLRSRVADASILVLEEELETAMRLLGARSAHELGMKHVGAAMLYLWSVTDSLPTVGQHTSPRAADL